MLCFYFGIVRRGSVSVTHKYWGNNKIVRTLPPLISSSEETFTRHNRRILAQLMTNQSPFLKSYLHKVGVNSHPSPLYPLCNTNTHTQLWFQHKI